MSDRGGEYTSNKLQRFCEDIVIKKQLIVGYSPHQNGVAERKNKTIVEMAKSMLHKKRLPYYLWGEVVNTAVYIFNRCLIRAVNDKTPFEAFSGRRQGLKHLKGFGCVCYSHIPGKLRYELDECSIRMVYVG